MSATTTGVDDNGLELVATSRRPKEEDNDPVPDLGPPSSEVSTVVISTGGTIGTT